MIGSTSVGPTGRVEYDGIVLEDRAEDSREILVYCKDILPLAQGSIVPTNQQQRVKTIDKDGNPTEILVETNNFIKCVYGGDTDNNNRVFPPDVRMGEHVRIFNMGDSDQWYWKGSDRTQCMRRTERIRWCANNTLSNNTEMDGSNTYYFEIDTRSTKAITLATSNSDGETYMYRFCISPADNTVILCDDNHNLIKLDSANTCITLSNHDGSFIKLDKKDIEIVCEGDIRVQSKNKSINLLAMDSVSMGSGGNTMDSATTGVMMDSAGNVDISAKKGNINIEADKNMTLKFPKSGSLGGGQSLSLTANSISLDKAGV